jgi:hypothetical protein
MGKPVSDKEYVQCGILTAINVVPLFAAVGASSILLIAAAHALVVFLFYAATSVGGVITYVQYRWAEIQAQVDGVPSAEDKAVSEPPPSKAAPNKESGGGGGAKEPPPIAQQVAIQI